MADTDEVELRFLEPAVRIEETGDDDRLQTALEADEQLRCEHCGKTFGTKRQIKRHVKTHMMGSARPYACGICDRRYKRACDADAHRRLHSSATAARCLWPACPFSTPNRSTLARHVKTHSGDYGHHCPLCGAGFHARTHLADHLNSHTGARPYECETCDASFACARYLQAHTAEAHRTHRCPFCGREFSQQRALRHHARRHTEEGGGVWPCEVCGKGLSSRDHLRVHRRVHTGERPYLCATCGHAFAKKCNLVSHERVHSGERPYACVDCDRRFNQRSALTTHRRTQHPPSPSPSPQITIISV